MTASKMGVYSPVAPHGSGANAPSKLLFVGKFSFKNNKIRGWKCLIGSSLGTKTKLNSEHPCLPSEICHCQSENCIFWPNFFNHTMPVIFIC